MALVVVLGVIGIGVGIGYWAGRSPVPDRPVPTPVSPPGGKSGSGSSGSDENASTALQNPMTSTVESEPMTTPPSNTIAQVSTNVAPANTNWEDTVDEIVGSDDPDTNKVKQLFALFAKLPPDGQEEVAQHLSNLVEDDAYGPLGDLLKNANLPQGVLDELMSDVLNRPNSLKLPMLLDVAQDPNNPEHDEAKDLLELYLGDDPSTNNWNNAGPMVTNWLSQNPD
jgi:hypothetical protein